MKIGNGRGKAKFRMLTLFVSTVALFSCATTANFERSVSSWIGADIKELRNAWGSPDQGTQLPNGNSEYAYNIDKRYGLTLPDTCVVYWEVDKQSQKIIRMRHEGTRCKRAPSCV